MADSLVAVRTARERAIAQLSNAYAHDELDVEEFERRLEIAHRTDSVAAIEELLKDISAASSSVSLVAKSQVALDRRETQDITAIFGGIQRTGSWTPAKLTRIRTIFGGAELDFREIQLPPGVTEINVLAIMGGVNVVVPPELAVEMEGSAFFGGFAHEHRAERTPDPERPLLRITGFAMMGGVNIETRLPGESGRAAHRRRRHQRRLERRKQRRLHL